MKILYSRGSNNRKARFALMTQIISDTDSLYVHKIALDKIAEPHINQLADDYRRIKLPKPFILPKAQRISPGTIRMPFIDGSNLEEEFFTALRQRDSESVLNILTMVENLITDGAERINPSKHEAYTQYFGDSFSTMTLCSTVGLMDYNFDNFIRKADRIYLVDYEWYFHDIAIPVDYLMSRLLYNTFAVKFKDTMFYLPTNTAPVVEVFDGYLVPAYVYKRYKKYLDKTSAMLKSEQSFQNYALITHDTSDVITHEYTYRSVDTQMPSSVEQMHNEKVNLAADREDLIAKNDRLEIKNSDNLQVIAALQENNKVLLYKINRLRNIPTVKFILAMRRKFRK